MFSAHCPREKEVIVLLWYTIHRTYYFSYDFWKTSAAENILTFILGGKQLNRDGKHDDVWAHTYVIHNVSCVTSHLSPDWMKSLHNYTSGKKHWATHTVAVNCHVPPQVLHLQMLQAHQHVFYLWLKSFGTGSSRWHFAFTSLSDTLSLLHCLNISKF